MIIATGNVNIDENKAAAENASNDAKNAANSAADEANKVKSTIDGKITTSSVAPFNDGVDHSDGDIWYVQDSDHNTTAMYTYDGSTWNQTKMTTSTMSVGQLSALTADLGTIDSGYINSVTLDSATINSGYIKSVTLDSTTINAGTIEANVSIKGAEYDGGSITNGKFSAGSISGSSIYDQNGSFQYWLNGSGFHTEEYGSQSVWILGNEITVGESSGRGSVTVDLLAGSASQFNSGLSTYGTLYVGNGFETKHATLNSDAGAFYFEGSGSGNGSGTVNIYAADVYSHGTALKSTLSDKRNISDYSTSEALAKINSTDVVKWQYIENDNDPFEQHIGPIIDNINDIGNKKYYVPNELIISDGKETAFNQSNAISMLISSVQELSKRNDELSFRITQLERNNNK